MAMRRKRAATVDDGCRIVLWVEFLARRDRARAVLFGFLLLSVATNVLMVLHLQEEYRVDDLHHHQHRDTFHYDGSKKKPPALVIKAGPKLEHAIKMSIAAKSESGRGGGQTNKKKTVALQEKTAAESPPQTAENPTGYTVSMKAKKSSAHSTATDRRRTGQFIAEPNNFTTTAAGSTKNVLPAEETSTGADAAAGIVSVVKRPRRVNSDVKDDDNQLHCEVFGGPHDDTALHDMMYWRSTDEFAVDETASTSPPPPPLPLPLPKKYLIFEPDEAGFSNVRLSFENVVALAKITGRILVLPPATRFVQLFGHAQQQQQRQEEGEGQDDDDDDDHRNKIPAYLLADVFKIRNLPVVTMQEFLETVPLTYRANGTRAAPPQNRTNWDGRLGNALQADPGDGPWLYGWLNSTMPTYEWEREKHIVVVGNGTLARQAMSAILEKERAVTAAESSEASSKLSSSSPFDRSMQLLQRRVVHFFGKPPAVDASLATRLHEFMGNRTELRTTAVYDREPFMMMQGHEATRYRPLIQFYAVYFFEDWRQGLWMKRYIRDNLRYADFIQCAAARIVWAMREQARRNGDENGSFDTMHIRRKDFRILPNYRAGTVPAANLVRDRYFTANRTVYIATDETDPAYFRPLREHYHVYLLQDFLPLVPGIDPNYYGMIEQLVCAKGDKFVGTFYSTFTAYITRLRGYYALRDQKPGHLLGSVTDSEYFGHKGVHRHVLAQYNSGTFQMWSREWPTAWRDIDHDLIT